MHDLHWAQWLILAAWVAVMGTAMVLYLRKEYLKWKWVRWARRNPPP